jgi:hypothetical protein
MHIVFGVALLLMIMLLCGISRSSRRTARRARRLPCPSCGEALLPAARVCPNCRNRVLRGAAARRDRLWHS